MGIAAASSVLHTMNNLSMEELYRIALSIKNSSGVSRAQPTIDIDASWLGYHCGTAKTNSVSSVTDIGMAFVNAGFHVCFVADNPTRFDWKRASWERAAQRAKARIEAIIMRVRLNNVVNQLSNDNIVGEEKASLEDEKRKLASKIKALEKKSTRSICSHFESRLEQAVETLNESSTLGTIGDCDGKMSFITAAYQADSCIARRRVKCINDIILSADSDFAVMASSSNTALLVIKEYQSSTLVNTTTKEKMRVLSNFTIYSPTAANLAIILEQANISNISSRCNAAKHPLFDECESSRMCALAAVGIGCDQHPGGVKGIGSSAVLNKIRSLKNSDGEGNGSVGSIETGLSSWLARKSSTSPEVMNTLTDALLYEPGNEEGGDKEYISDPPETLESYLKEMATDDVTITEALPMAHCPGPCSGLEHQYLVGECNEIFVCSSCHAKVCRFCVATLAKDGESPVKLCLPCYNSNAILPGSSINTEITVMEMRAKLAEAGVQCNLDTDPNVVEDLYVEHIMAERLKLFDSSEIKFPALASKELPKVGSESGGGSNSIRSLGWFDWNNGGSFLRKEGLTAEIIADLVILLAEVVSMSTDSFEKEYQQALCRVLPKLVVDFSKGARLDGAWRLMYRAIRGALDQRCPSILKSLGSIIEYNDKIGILIEGDVRASMKGKVYNGSVAFTRDCLVACSCKCKAGSENNERVACVHTMAKIYQLHIFLIDCLADHVIYELAAAWTKQMEVSLSDDRRMEMLLALKRLISTAGLDEKIINLQPSKRESIHGMLSAFSVGTEQRKLTPPPADPLKLGPLRLLKGKVKSLVGSATAVVERASKKAKEITREKLARIAAGYSPPTFPSSNSETATSIDDDSSNVPDYDMTFAMVKAISELHPSCTKGKEINENVGYKLLNLRKSISSSRAEVALKQQAKQKMLKLEIAATSRNRRPSKKQNNGASSTPSPSTNNMLSPEELAQRDRIRALIGYTPPQPPAKKKKCTLKKSDVFRGGCYFLGCTCSKNNNGDNNIKWTRIPFLPKPLAKNASDKIKATYAVQKLYRSEFCDRIGRSRKDDAKEKRICGIHPFVKVHKYTHYTSQSGKVRRIRVEMEVPDNDGIKAMSNIATKSPSRGIAFDRLALNTLKQMENQHILNDLQQQINDGGPSGEIAALKKEIDSMRKLLQQMSEICIDDDVSLINESVREAYGLGVHNGKSNAAIGTTKLGRKKTLVPLNKKQRGVKRKLKADEDIRKDMPVATLDITDDEVNRLTGFATKEALLACIAIICEGDDSVMADCSTELTWFEEWLCYFEVVGGMSTTRQRDAIARYGSRRRIKRVVQNKLKQVLKARNKWPRYASIEEDEMLRDPKWNERYTGLRIVMWDNTNLDMKWTPSDAEIQSSTYSSYYNGNVGKGGIFLQLCGWLGSHELWMGAVSDTEYFQRSGILEFQKDFAKDGVAFVNILDRGYRASRAAMQAGKQIILQPAFAPSDRKFNTEEVISSAAIASDRSGNERAVKRCKMSGFLRRGLEPAQNVDEFADVWLAWSFQANFMYKPVL